MSADSPVGLNRLDDDLDITDLRSTWRIEAPKPGPQKACLTVLNGALVGRSFPVEPGRMVIGRGEDCDLVLNDEGVSRRHALILAAPDGSVTVKDLDSTNGSTVNGKPCAMRELIGGERLQFGSRTVFKFELRDSIEEKLANYLYDSAIRDRLTGVYNDHHLREQLASEFDWHQRHKVPLSLIFLDIDHFKTVNDDYGHLGGDEILRQVARRVQRETRDSDLFARYGGEEFACLLRRTPLATAATLAERMRRAVAATPVALGSERDARAIGITLSAGVAQTNRGTRTPEELIAAADRRLYEAKAGGRNRVAPALLSRP